MMDAKTIKATQAAVRVWRRRARGTYTGKGGPDGCPLCKLFWKDDDEVTCKGCPVYTVTGQIHCHGSPHQVWCHLDNDRTLLLKRATVAEANFLNALLPVKHRLPSDWDTKEFA